MQIPYCRQEYAPQEDQCSAQSPPSTIRLNLLNKLLCEWITQPARKKRTDSPIRRVCTKMPIAPPEDEPPWLNHEVTAQVEPSHHPFEAFIPIHQPLNHYTKCERYPAHDGHTKNATCIVLEHGASMCVQGSRGICVVCDEAREDGEKDDGNKCPTSGDLEEVCRLEISNMPRDDPKTCQKPSTREL